MYILALGDDVQIKILKHYIAFKRIKNFACLEVHPQTGKILLYRVSNLMLNSTLQFLYCSSILSEI
ncbi:hypothetical protein COK19_09685 [Bacillus cereus]|nr:hypothetical protein COK19_09685 [Bacillus cereus]